MFDKYKYVNGILYADTMCSSYGYNATELELTSIEAHMLIKERLFNFNGNWIGDNRFKFFGVNISIQKNPKSSRMRMYYKNYIDETIWISHLLEEMEK